MAGKAFYNLIEKLEVLRMGGASTLRFPALCRTVTGETPIRNTSNCISLKFVVM